LNTKGLTVIDILDDESGPAEGIINSRITKHKKGDEVRDFNFGVGRFIIIA
jgi:hypothetical protein